MQEIMAFAVIGVALAGGVAMLRHLRATKAIRTQTGRCQSCGAHGPVMQVTYHQNTGMFIMRQHREFGGTACRRCSVSLYGKTSLHNLTLGWWGMISVVLTAVFLIHNTGIALWSLTLPSPSEVAKNVLEAHREYALNLLATKDERTVVEVLVRQCNASEREVSAFVQSLKRAA